MNFIWNTFFYNPLYNLLTFFISITPNGDLGVAVILLTILVKIVLFPLSKKAIVSQFKLKQIQPKIDAIKAEIKDKQLQAQKIFSLYKEEKVNPFSSCVVLLIQLPILFALYRVFFNELGTIDPQIVYSFIQIPEHIHTQFMGFIEMSKPYIPLALLAGISQYFQLKLQPITQEKPLDQNDTQAMMAYSIGTQMKYVLPVLIFIFCLKLPSALALYWFISNVITIIQEYGIKKSLEK